jgi:hypothetical protein
MEYLEGRGADMAVGRRHRTTYCILYIAYCVNSCNLQGSQVLGSRVCRRLHACRCSGRWSVLNRRRTIRFAPRPDQRSCLGETQTKKAEKQKKRTKINLNADTVCFQRNSESAHHMSVRHTHAIASAFSLAGLPLSSLRGPLLWPPSSRRLSPFSLLLRCRLGRLTKRPSGCGFPTSILHRANRLQTPRPTLVQITGRGCKTLVARRPSDTRFQAYGPETWDTIA